MRDVFLEFELVCLRMILEAYFYIIYKRKAKKKERELHSFSFLTNTIIQIKITDYERLNCDEEVNESPCICEKDDEETEDFHRSIYARQLTITVENNCIFI